MHTLYCDFTSDNYRSDVMVYRDADGKYYALVARQHLDPPDDFPVITDDDSPHEVTAKSLMQQDAIHTVRRTAIDHPAAGSLTTFRLPGLALDYLGILMMAGLHVPADVCARLSREAVDNPSPYTMDSIDHSRCVEWAHYHCVHCEFVAPTNSGGVASLVGHIRDEHTDVWSADSELRTTSLAWLAENHCPTCDNTGIVHTFKPQLCPDCPSMNELS